MGPYFQNDKAQKLLVNSHDSDLCHQKGGGLQYQCKSMCEITLS